MKSKECILLRVPDSIAAQKSGRVVRGSADREMTKANLDRENGPIVAGKLAGNDGIAIH
jgi:hypothetical protein